METKVRADFTNLLLGKGRGNKGSASPSPSITPNESQKAGIGATSSGDDGKNAITSP